MVGIILLAYTIAVLSIIIKHTNSELVVIVMLAGVLITIGNIIGMDETVTNTFSPMISHVMVLVYVMLTDRIGA